MDYLISFPKSLKSGFSLLGGYFEIADNYPPSIANPCLL